MSKLNQVSRHVLQPGKRPGMGEAESITYRAEQRALAKPSNVGRAAAAKRRKRRRR